MLFDKVRIKVRAGRGGNGAVYFDALRKPSGGNGGAGANVALRASSHAYDFRNLKNVDEFVGPDGGRGGKEKRTGADGNEFVVTVPEGTYVYNERNEPITKVIEHGTTKVVAKGGQGGLGNHHFRRGQFMTADKFTEGKPGEEFLLNLVLKIRSDVIFIGYPNAGKSSMLNELTNADAKVAAYAFTTLDPQLGDADGIRLLDLPGLIEGTHEGKGLGTRFVKHTENTKLVAHFVSVENDDVNATYESMRAELERIDTGLAKKPEVLVLTKSDELDKDELAAKVDLMKKYNLPIITTTILDDSAKKFLETVKSHPALSS